MVRKVCRFVVAPNPSEPCGALTGRASIFDFEIFLSAFVDNHLLCHDQPTITQSRRSVLNFKFSVLSFSRLMSWWAALWALSKNCVKWKKIQLHSMSNVMRCINKRFAFKNSGISCLALIFIPSNPRNDNPVLKKAVPGCYMLRSM